MNLRSFEKKIFRLRNAYERKAARDVYKIIKSQIEDVGQYVGAMSPNMLINNVDIIVSEEPIKKWIKSFYQSCAVFGVLYRNQLLSQKSIEDEMWESQFGFYLGQFIDNVGGEKIVSITETTRQFIKNILRGAMDEGLSVDNTAELIRKGLRGSLSHTRKRAVTIARTELISASNKTAIDGLDSTGVLYKKSWSTSGLANVRDSHIRCEMESVNGIAKDARFSNGLLYPGDQSGAPEEVINCRCTLLFIPV